MRSTLMVSRSSFDALGTSYQLSDSPVLLVEVARGLGGKVSRRSVCMPWRGRQRLGKSPAHRSTRGTVTIAQGPQYRRNEYKFKPSSSKRRCRVVSADGRSLSGNTTKVSAAPPLEPWQFGVGILLLVALSSACIGEGGTDGDLRDWASRNLESGARLSVGGGLVLSADPDSYNVGLARLASARVGQDFVHAAELLADSASTGSRQRRIDASAALVEAAHRTKNPRFAALALIEAEKALLTSAPSSEAMSNRAAALIGLGLFPKAERVAVVDHPQARDGSGTLAPFGGEAAVQNGNRIAWGLLSEHANRPVETWCAGSQLRAAVPEPASGDRFWVEFTAWIETSVCALKTSSSVAALSDLALALGQFESGAWTGSRTNLVTLQKSEAIQAVPVLRATVDHFALRSRRHIEQVQPVAFEVALAEQEAAGYLPLSIQSNGELATAYYAEGSLGLAMLHLEAGLGKAIELDDRSEESRFRGLLARTLLESGRTERAWREVVHSLTLAHQEQNFRAAYSASVSGSWVARHFGQPRISLLYRQASKAFAEQMGRPGFVIDALVWSAFEHTSLGDSVAFDAAVHEALLINQDLSEPSERTRTLADVSLVRARNLLGTAPERSLELIDCCDGSLCRAWQQSLCCLVQSAAWRCLCCTRDGRRGQRGTGICHSIPAGSRITSPTTVIDQYVWP